MFIIGLIVGLVIGVPFGMLMLGLCAAAARGDQAMDAALLAMEREARERVHITGGGNGNF